MASIQVPPQSPFHHGEQQIHARLGIDVQGWGQKVIRDYLTAQHRTFHTSMPFLVISARDETGHPWATIIEGPDGFVSSPDDRSLIIDAGPVAGDALTDALKSGADLGVLGIELETRRRNRVNGRVVDDTNGILTFNVAQAFGNCPQYIRERRWARVTGNRPGQPRRGTALTSSQQLWIARADTFFIASGYQDIGDNPSFGMDASHRGGDRGFVEIQSATRLRFPDYAGNNFYNTLGNLMLDPRAGYLFVDFETGSLLQITGRAAIDWDSGDVALFPGARRLITLDVDEIIELPSALSLRWSENTGPARALRVVDKIRESTDITSFVFESHDGGALPAFDAGQYLPLEFKVSGMKQLVDRPYSLSGAPNDPRYRITVKREPHGVVSGGLHDEVEVGQTVNARLPSGDFVLPQTACPVVLIGAGVGVTPLVSMLHAITDDKPDRPVWFIHGVRDGAHHLFKSEVLNLAKGTPEIQTHFVYSQPARGDVEGRDYDSRGRVSGQLINNLIGDLDADYMICGPMPFMSGLRIDLESRGVHTDRIHWESFGPSGQ